MNLGQEFIEIIVYLEVDSSYRYTCITTALKFINSLLQLTTENVELKADNPKARYCT